MLQLNLMLAIAWIAVSGNFTWSNFVVGFAFGSIAIWVTRLGAGGTTYFIKLRRLVRFAGFFLVELIKANLRVAYDVLTSHHYMRPAIIRVPLDLKTREEIVLLSNLITLTPGTLTLDVAGDRQVLYVHVMYVTDVEAARRDIKEGLERRVGEVFE